MKSYDNYNTLVHFFEDFILLVFVLIAICGRLFGIGSACPGLFVRFLTFVIKKQISSKCVLLFIFLLYIIL